MVNSKIKLVAQITRGMKFLAAFEAIGGIIGIVLILMIPSLEERLGAASFFAAIYAISILAGWWLWKGENRGLNLSKVLWAVQIPVIIIVHLGWKFTLGFGLPVVLAFDGSGFSVGLRIEISNCLLHHPPQVAIGINVVAVVILIYLFRTSGES